MTGLEFLHPQVLWLLLIPALFWILLIIRGQRRIAAFFSQEVYAKLSKETKTVSAEVRITLFSLALMMMLIALAQPVIEKERVKINQKAIDLIVAMDISRSMEAKDLYPNRLAWAKKKLLSLIGHTEGIRIGVMAFAENAYVVTPITEDKDVASYLVQNLETGSITEKGTNLLQLLDTASGQLKDELHKYLLIISDGGDATDYSEAIALAKERGLTLFVLATATAKGAPIEEKGGSFVKKEGKIVLTQLNEKIKDLALETGGVYIESIAADEDISVMLQEIKKIAVEQEVDTKTVKRYVQLFVYFLVIAAVLLLYALHSLPKKSTLAVTAFIASLALPQPSYAGLTDFQYIDEAQALYQAKEYGKSQKAFESVDASPQRDYNIANTLYRQKRYKEAIKAYEKLPKTSELRQKALHNMGNAYAYAKEIDKAIAAYEEALKLGEDRDTRENLETLKKLKQNQQQKNKKNDQKKQKDSKDQKKKDQKGSKKEQQEKQSKEQKDKNGESKQQKQEKKSASQKEKEQAKKSKKDDKKEAQKVQSRPQRSQKELTDKEEKKLLQQLQMQKGKSFRYPVESAYKRKEHDKPW